MGERIALGVMARAPSDERGKTRLVRSLGIRDGTALRQAILLDTLSAATSVINADVVMLFAPASARDEMTGLPGSVCRAVPQRGQTLGDRLRNGFADLFALGYGGVAIIGSDLPTVPSGHLDRGLEALLLASDPVVLGPAEDGGYYFIGLRHPHPELFQGVPWSTGEVLAVTQTLAASASLRVTLIPSWYDVDSVADLERAVAAVGEGPGAAQRVARHLGEWAAGHWSRGS